MLAAFNPRLARVALGPLAVALAVVALVGCGATDGAGGTPPLTFTGPPALTVASASGLLRVDVRWSPDPPVVGLDACELTVTDGAGAPAAGLTLTVVPWMPAHGHGTSTAPAVSEAAPGIYVATPIAFYMPGQWELRTTMAGTVDDSAVPALELR